MTENDDTTTTLTIRHVDGAGHGIATAIVDCLSSLDHIISYDWDTHLQWGERNIEPTKLVSKGMMVRADQLMLHDVVSDDGYLGTVYSIDVDTKHTGDVTVMFLDGQNNPHDFVCDAGQELMIVRGNQEA